MFNAIKTIAAALLLAAVGTACSGNNERAAVADSLLERARQSASSGNYSEAVDFLDTLDISYRDCVEQRRQGARLRIETLMSLVQDSIEADEARRPALQAAVDSLAPLFQQVKLPGTDGFTVLKSAYTGSDLNSTTIQARIDEKGIFFVIVNLNGKKIGLNAIKYGGASADGHSIAVESSEIMSLPQESLVQLSQAIANAPAGKLEIQFVGSKGSAKSALTAKQADAYRTTWRYAQLSQALNLANIRREKYERQIEELAQRLKNLDQE